MAARIRLFISIKSQSVQIRRCNIGRGGRSCLVFENPFVQFGEGAWFLCLPTQWPKIEFWTKDWLPIRICIFFALANLWIWASSSAVKKMWFHWTSSFFRRHVSALEKKRSFSWPSKMHNLKCLVVSDFGKQNDYLAMYPKISQSLYLAKEQVDKLTDSRLAMKIIIGGALSTNLAGKSSKLGKPFRSLRNHLEMWLLENMFLFSLRSRCFKLPEFLESNSKSSSARLRSQCCNTTCSKPLASTEASRDVGNWGICMCFFGENVLWSWGKILSITNNLCFKL